MGSFDLQRTQLALNAGNDSIAGRLSGSYVKDDGYTNNILTGEGLDAQDAWSLRGQLRFQLGDNADLTLLAQSTRDDGSVGYGISTDPTFRLFPDNFYGLVVPANLQRRDERNIRIDSPTFSRRDSNLYSATLNWNLGEVGVKSITGVTRYDASDALDYDFTGDFNETFTSSTEVDSFSQEIQIFNRNPDKFDWTAGLFYYEDDGTQSFDWRVPFPFARGTTENKGEAIAVFGQGTYNFNDQWAVQVGARYNEDKKVGSQTNLLASTTTNVSETFDSFTPQGQILYRPSEDILIYAGISQGFKSGGFNLLAAGTPTIYKPEEIIAYEAGVKATLYNGRLIQNASVFHYDYTDLQLRTLVFTGAGGGAFATVSNAEGATIDGVEFQTDLLLGQGFSFALAGTYLDATFDQYISPSNNLDLSGTPLPLSPKWSGSASIGYEGEVLGGALRSHLEYVYRGKIIFPLTLDAPQNFDEKYGAINASVRWTEPNEKFYVEIIGRNLDDTLYRVQRADVFFSGVYDSFGPPRTVEARVGFSF
jgi:iron complex outermembrane receptor protein